MLVTAGCQRRRASCLRLRCRRRFSCLLSRRVGWSDEGCPALAGSPARWAVVAALPSVGVSPWPLVEVFPGVVIVATGVAGVVAA